jgi:6-phosphogluconate dehydrogenase
MLALVTMDHPVSYDAEAVRPKRAEILRTLKQPSREEMERFTFRAQYLNYRSIPGVSPNSQTETYFKIVAYLESPCWQGVPVFLESGKRLGKDRKQISVIFKHIIPCLCPKGEERHFRNGVIFTLEPEEGITIYFGSKKTGLGMEMEERSFVLPYRKDRRKMPYVEEYEKILTDCIVGDQTLFVNTDEIRAMWEYIDPIVMAWRENLVPLRFYRPDTDEVLAESRIVERAPKPESTLRKEIGIVGLGKMGGNIARHLIEKGWMVAGFNRTAERTKNLEKEGLTGTYSVQELVGKLKPPRLIWLMLTSGEAVEQMLFGENALLSLLVPGDAVVDGGNSFYKDSLRRARILAERGIEFVDAGVSGGPEGARYGACIIVGGKKQSYMRLLPLFLDLAVDRGVSFFEGNGAGHFVKMIHNGIEYGMMQAIAEGFNILKNAVFKLDLEEVAKVYNHGSVIESRLIRWLERAFDLHGEELTDVSGSVGYTGEAEWTVQAAKELGLKTKIIDEALKFRIESQKHASYAGKILSALREQFGGHEARIEGKEITELKRGAG